MNRFNLALRRKPPRLALLVWITISGTMPIHIFVPALPAVAAYFQASAGAVQLTITVYIIGLAVGQLIYGPLSDRYGRRPVLLIGLTAYTVATLAAAFAGSLEMFVLDRVAQALGGCAGMVMGRTIARDNVTGHDAIGRLAKLLVAMSLTPALAPILGAQLSVHFGWRSILYVMSVANVLMLVVAYLTLAETHHSRGTRTAREYATSYFHLLRSRVFVAYGIGGAAGTTSFFAFVSASPFVLVEELGVSTQVFSLIYVMIIAGNTLGAVCANHLSRRVKEEVALRIGGMMLLGSMVVAAAAYATGLISVPLITLTMMVFVFGGGITSPFAMAGASNIEPAYAGAAQGLFGFFQMTYAALCTAIIAAGSAHPTRTMIATLLASSIISIVAFEYARRVRRIRVVEVPAE